MRSVKVFLVLVTMAVSASFLSFEVGAGGKGDGSGSYRHYKGGRAIDGDTFRYRGERFRIQQYDAPEVGQPGWRRATRSLQNKINSGSHEWEPVAKDEYGRTIVRERKAD